MSKVKWEAIWQHDKVLPYILNDIKEKVEKITPVHKIYLFGSRAKIPVEEWGKLEGKDWDIVVQAGFGITNTHGWTSEKNYHIDLYVFGEKQTNDLLHSVGKAKQLYPTNEISEELLKI